MKAPRFLVLASLMAIILAGAPARAEIPSLMAYQGRLTDSTGEALADGSYDLTFGIFGAQTNGFEHWSETQTAVPVSNGLFAVILGTSVPLTDSAFADPERYLGVSVNGVPVLPRTRITATAYANRIATVDGSTGGDIIGKLTILDPDDLLANKLLRDITRIELDPSGSIALYDPVDSKAGGAVPVVKRVELLRNGLVMYGVDSTDTTLVVTPSGDIIGVGQITMGENSSSGTETSVLGFRNTAEGDSSTIGGGSSNLTTGTISVIAGGHANTASGEGSVISGGSYNENNGEYAVIAGGQDNIATGEYSVIPGGQYNTTNGGFSYAAGRRAQSLHDGSFVWADHTDADFTSTDSNQFVIRAGGGVGIGTNNPSGQLDVVAPDGDGSVNLPGDAIASPEILDESGVASTQTVNTISLIQGAEMATLTSITITAPADGYIILNATAVLETWGTQARNQAFIQIDDAEGGGTIPPFFSVAGAGDHDSPNARHFWSMASQRVFPVTAGTHTFYLEGKANPLNPNDAISSISNPSLTGIFVPTSYGAVTANGGAITPAAR